MCLKYLQVLPQGLTVFAPRCSQVSQCSGFIIHLIFFFQLRDFFLKKSWRPNYSSRGSVYHQLNINVDFLVPTLRIYNPNLWIEKSRSDWSVILLHRRPPSGISSGGLGYKHNRRTSDAMKSNRMPERSNSLLLGLEIGIRSPKR